MLQVIVTAGSTVHVDPVHVPELVWRILENSGDDPYELLRQVIRLSVEYAREDPTTQESLT